MQKSPAPLCLGDAALAFRLWNAEPAERTRHGIASVIGDDQERRRAVFIAHRDRGRIIGR